MFISRNPRRFLWTSGAVAAASLAALASTPGCASDDTEGYHKTTTKTTVETPTDKTTTTETHTKETHINR